MTLCLGTVVLELNANVCMLTILVNHVSMLTFAN